MHLFSVQKGSWSGKMALFFSFASITAGVTFDDLDICSTPKILIHFCRSCSASTLLRARATEKL